MMNCDLHSHSIYSDGELSPKEIVREAKKLKLRCISLTDHNSVSGVKEAISEGEKLNIEVIPGVEIFSDCSEILGYFIDINNKELKKLLKKNCEIQDKLGKKTLKIFQNYGFDITYNKVVKKYGYPVMNINSIRYITSTLGFNRKKSGEIIDALRNETFYPSGEAYYKTKWIKAEKIIKVILKAGGVPVLAHPWFQGEYEKRIPSLVKAGLKGIEANGPGGRGRTSVKIDKKKIDKLAKQYNLIKTGGSDFHGKWRNPLGEYRCDYSIVEKLKKLRRDKVK